MPKKQGEPNVETVEERIFCHDDNAFHTRTDWFLVGHAILFEAFVAAIGSDAKTQGHAVAVPVWIFGVVAAWSWLATSQWQRKTLDRVKARFRDESSVYDEVQEDRDRRYPRRPWWALALFPWQHGTGVFGLVLPIACLLAWLGMGGAAWSEQFGQACFWLYGRPVAQIC